MDSQRRLLRPWVCGSLELTARDEARPQPGFSRREGPSAHFRTYVSDGSRFLPDTTGDVFLFLPSSLAPMSGQRNMPHFSARLLQSRCASRGTGTPRKG